jgi:ribosomal protein S18 acetylase RimI-like enzyme
MKTVNISEDEQKLTGLGFEAEVFDAGRNEAEVKLSVNKLSEMNPSAAAKKVGRLVRKVTKHLVKKGFRSVFYIAERGTPLVTALSMCGACGLDHSEYMMKWQADEDEIFHNEAGIVFTGGEEDDTDLEQKDAIVVNSAEPDAFSAKLMPYKDGMYVYEVEVKRELRRQGYGTRYMHSVMNSFKDMPLYLQVGSKNTAACALYKKLGFEVSQELCYYKG